MKKKIIIILSMILCSAVALMSSFLYLFPPKPSRQSVSSSFYKNEEQFIKLAEELSICSEDYFLISLDDGKLSFEYSEPQISEETKKSLLDFFESTKIMYIIKNEDDEVVFQRWCALSDRSCGIVYTKSYPPKLDFLSAFEVLKTEGWFYYETDCNKVR